MLLLPLLALAASLTLHFLALKLFPRLGLVDFPARYGLKRRPLPYPIGAVQVLVFLVFFLYVEPKAAQMLGIFTAVLLLGIFSFLDDRRPLPVVVRLGVQVMIALVIFATGSWISTITNPLEGFLGGQSLPLDTWDLIIPLPGRLPIVLPLLSGIFTVLWLGTTMNALNWSDGVTGQVNVLACIAYITIGTLSLSARVGQPDLALIAFVLAAITLGGLPFSFPPAKAILGDTGAMFHGLMIGILTITAGGKVATGFLVLGVPLIDFGIVILRRLFKGASPLRGNADDEHLHHRLLKMGWSERQIIALTAALGTVFGVTALFMTTFQKFLAAGVLVIVMLVLSWYSRPRVV